MSLEFRSKEVHVNSIRVPWDTIPSAEKIAKCYSFYKQYGILDRVIVIDSGMYVRDGLVGLMVARAVGMKRVPVLQVTEEKDKPAKPKKPLFSECACYHLLTDGRGECWGTRERDTCTCEGNLCRCDFYPGLRAGAVKEAKEVASGDAEV